MESISSKKQALVRMMQILIEETDLNNPMTQEQIRDRLNDRFGIVIRRQTVADHLALLQELRVGANQVREKDRVRYYGLFVTASSRHRFDNDSLRIMIDALRSSRYLSAIDAKQTVEYLLEACGRKTDDTVKCSRFPVEKKSSFCIGVCLTRSRKRSISNMRSATNTTPTVPICRCTPRPASAYSPFICFRTAAGIC